jgi:hypothetical protein
MSIDKGIFLMQMTTMNGKTHGITKYYMNLDEMWSR